MAERRWHPDQLELEQALRDLGRHLDYPPTPDLSLRIRGRLSGPPRPFWARLLPASRPLAAALVALLVLVGSVLALLPDARGAVAERLGLPGVAIDYLPLAEPGATRAPVGLDLNLGELSTLTEAQAQVEYRVLVPTLAELGDPDEVYVSQVPPGGQVALVYPPRSGLPAAAETGVGLLITQFDGRLVQGQFGKGLGEGTVLEEVTVNGHYGLWIEGEPHLLFSYQDATGQPRGEPSRLAANVLLWQQGNLTLRLESALSKEEGLHIAASMR